MGIRINPKTFTFDELERAVIVEALRREAQRHQRNAGRGMIDGVPIGWEGRGRRERAEMEAARVADLLKMIEEA